jgi:hypothetical protein
MAFDQLREQLETVRVSEKIYTVENFKSIKKYVEVMAQ